MDRPRRGHVHALAIEDQRAVLALLDHHDRRSPRGDHFRGLQGVRTARQPLGLFLVGEEHVAVAVHQLEEFAPVPGRPILPVISARLMIACAVRVDSWPWFTPIVHQKETRFPSAMVCAK